MYSGSNERPVHIDDCLRVVEPRKTASFKSNHRDHRGALAVVMSRSIACREMRLIG